MKKRTGVIAILLVIIALLVAIAVLVLSPAMLAGVGSSAGGMGGDGNIARDQQVQLAYQSAQQPDLAMMEVRQRNNPLDIIFGEEEPPEGPVSNVDNSQIQTDQRLIIKNGDVTLVVEDADDAAQQVARIASQYGGYVLNSKAQLDDDLKSAVMTITVQAENFDAAMESLRGIAKIVLNESSSGQDVTAEYIDLESRLRNLELTRDRLQGFMAEAATVEEALAVSRELSTIEAEIEQVKGRMQYLTGRAALSTIRVDIRVEEAAPLAGDWSPGVTLRQAARAQTLLFRWLIEALIWLIVVPGPYLLGIGLIVLGVRAYRRRNAKPAPVVTTSEDEP